MGEIADMMLDGTMCEGCGEWMDDVFEGNFEAPGYPRYCSGCGGSETQMSTEDWAEFKADGKAKAKQREVKNTEIATELGIEIKLVTNSTWEFRRAKQLAHFYPTKNEWRDVRKSRKFKGNIKAFNQWWEAKFAQKQGEQ